MIATMKKVGTGYCIYMKDTEGKLHVPVKKFAYCYPTFQTARDAWEKLNEEMAEQES